MKINLTEIIKNRNITPFKWGDSDKDLLKIFPEWKKEIEDSRNSKYPYIEIDSVEFYFDKDYYHGLSEIIIKLWNFDKNYLSDYFETGWLKNDLMFSRVFEIMASEKWRFELTKGPKYKTPIILPNRKVLFAFDSLLDENDDKNNSKLQKIYIRKDEYTIEFINGGKEKVMLYNTF